MCLYPRTIRNKRYEPNKKNDGIIPVVYDSRALKVQIPCENCIECRKQKAREWQVRLQEDIKTNTGAKFITLTFSNESIKYIHEQLGLKNKRIIKRTITLKNGKKRNYYTNETYQVKQPTGFELDNAIATWAMRQFNERYRKKYKKALRHWTVTELGHQGTENIHLHGIIWPTGIDKDGKQCTMEEIENIWEYGFVWKYKQVGQKLINYVNARTVNYIVKYISKRDEKYQHYKSKILCSPGIGNNYTKTITAQRNTFNGTKTRQFYLTSTGHKIALPKYYRNKIYTDLQREELWMNSLDTQTTYVCGEKVHTTERNEELFKLRAYYRKKNRRLGYGSYHKDQDRLTWEENRRAEKFQLRINKKTPASPDE